MDEYTLDNEHTKTNESTVSDYFLSPYELKPYSTHIDIF